MAKFPGADLSRLLDTAFGSARGDGAERRPASDDCATLEPIAVPLGISLDFGPLSGPDPYRAGRIAAVHAMSDVYAMGAIPKAALAIVVVDPELPEQVATSTLGGMVDACAADGVELVGGHTVVGPEAMAGLSVIGEQHASVLQKTGAVEGDRLMLSKPVGTGMVIRAFRYGVLDYAAVAEALAVMEHSNREASLAAVGVAAHACTDVTGFGFLGHLSEMLAADGLGAIVSLKNVKVLDAARGLGEQFSHSKWIEENFEYAQENCDVRARVSRTELGPLLDPQTSGGLLVAVDVDRRADLVRHGFTEVGVVTSSSTLEVMA